MLEVSFAKLSAVGPNHEARSANQHAALQDNAAFGGRSASLRLNG
jgi:hypothetical protein